MNTAIKKALAAGQQTRALSIQDRVIIPQVVVTAKTIGLTHLLLVVILLITLLAYQSESGW